MKKIIVCAMAVLMVLSSCTTTGAGALTGAWFGGAVGSAVGGIAGGFRGSDIGRLVGMAVGAGTGAAIASAAENQERRAYYEERVRRSGRDYDDRYAGDYSDGRQNRTSEVMTYADECPLSVSNARYVNDKETVHLSKGETAKVTFEIHNTSDKALTNIVPMVKETTGNKKILVSQPVMVESIAPRRTLRYTASISAYKSLKSGKANFELYVIADGKVVSNIVEFDVPLE